MKRRLPSLSALRAFEAAARLGRMSAAADELAVTHGAISRQVRHLEDTLGVPLFTGSKARPTLTEAGRALLPGLTEAFDRMEAAVRSCVDSDDSTLDVSCLSTFLMRWLIPRLHRFNASNPDLDVRLRATDQTAPHERFDVLITVDEAPAAIKPTDKPTTTQPLFAEWLGLVAAPSLMVTSPPDAAVDVSSLPRLHTKTRRNAWAMWSALANQPLPESDRPVVEFEHYYYTLEAALAGLGVCVAPWHLVADDVRSGRLLAPCGFRLSGYAYVATWRRRSRNTDRFCAWLADEAKAIAPPPGAPPPSTRPPSQQLPNANDGHSVP